MGGLDLLRLFDSKLNVAVSSGVVHPEEVAQLSPLEEDETPAGYDSWAEKRRREYRSGRHHAKQALMTAGAEAATIGRDDDGVPLFPRGFGGSITHTGKETTFAAAVVTCSQAKVGMDAEVLRELPNDMIDHILTRTERGMLSEIPKARTPTLKTDGDRALLAFSAKEAFYKCIFPSLRCRLNFHDVEFRLLEPAQSNGTPGGFQLTLLRPHVEFPESSLRGAYLCDPRHVICGVSWSNNAPTSPT